MRIVHVAALAATSLLMLSFYPTMAAAPPETKAPAAAVAPPAAAAAAPQATPKAPVETTQAPVQPAAEATAPAAAANAPPVAEAKPVAPPKPIVPTLVAKVNLTSQTMTVLVNGRVTHSWKVSSGAPGYGTPVGTFKPDWMAKMWFSKQYDDAPMPHSVFFKDGAAVHATASVGRLGTAASHGCVRLSPANAEAFYKLVTRHGLAMTRIAVSGQAPGRQPRQEDLIARRDGRRDGAARTQWAMQPAPVRMAQSQTAVRSSGSGSQYAYPGDRSSYGYPGSSVQANRTPYWAR